MYSMSLFSSLDFLATWYASSEVLPALFTTSWVLDTITSLRLIWQTLDSRVVAETALKLVISSPSGYAFEAAAAHLCSSRVVNPEPSLRTALGSNPRIGLYLHP